MWCIILYWSFGNEEEVKYSYQISPWREKVAKPCQKIAKIQLFKSWYIESCFSAKIVWMQKENITSVHYYYLCFTNLIFLSQRKEDTWRSDNLKRSHQIICSNIHCVHGMAYKIILVVCPQNILYRINQFPNYWTYI